MFVSQPHKINRGIRGIWINIYIYTELSKIAFLNTILFSSSLIFAPVLQLQTFREYWVDGVSWPVGIKRDRKEKRAAPRCILLALLLFLFDLIRISASFIKVLLQQSVQGHTNNKLLSQWINYIVVKYMLYCFPEWVF